MYSAFRWLSPAVRSVKMGVPATVEGEGQLPGARGRKRARNLFLMLEAAAVETCWEMMLEVRLWKGLMVSARPVGEKTVQGWRAMRGERRGSMVVRCEMAVVRRVPVVAMGGGRGGLLGEGLGVGFFEEEKG